MNTNINIRVSEEEKSLIKQKAKKAGMKMSEYIRCLALSDVEIKITTEIKVK